MRRRYDQKTPPVVGTSAGGRFEISVKAPTLGLITRIPADQPDPRASQAASNVRFDDGVARAAPGYGRLTLSPGVDSEINLIFQAELMSSTTEVTNDVAVISTGRKLMAVTRLLP
jgi:hypothetical protein